MNQFSSTAAVTLSANPVVEKCLAKLANEVTEQVRDKIIDILIAVLTRKCEDFDGESVRRLLVTELETTPLTFAVEKRASGTTKTTKTLKEKEPKEKKVRSPKEPKEKAPKAVLSEEEREARKAAKQAEKEAKKEAAKAAKQAEKEAEKEARKAAKKAEREAAKEANKDADKEAAKAAKLAEKEAEKAAKLAEREAAKAARKAEKDAEREATKAAKQAEKEAAAAAAPAVVKEQRLPIPWCGARILNRCEALRVYHGLFAQCTGDATEISAFCPSCEKSGAKFGTCAMRAACGLFDYVAPNGKKCVRLANVIHKFGFPHEQAFQEEAAEHNITIPYEHLEKEKKQRGRPKSTSPRASKVATSDTGSGSETETDDEEHQEKRKQVSKVAASAEAPKKRGRPAKNPKSDVTPSDEVIQDLVASAAAMSVTSTPSTPSTPSSTPAAVTPKTSPVVVETPAAPKKAAKAMTLKKPAQRKTRVIEEQTFWVDTFNGAEILIRQEDNATFEASTGEPLGFWDEATKTIIECDDEDEE